MSLQSVPAPSAKEKLHVPSAICPTPEEYQSPGTMNQSLSLQSSYSLFGDGGVLSTPRAGRRGKQAAGSLHRLLYPTALYPTARDVQCEAWLSNPTQSNPLQRNAVNYKKIIRNTLFKVSQDSCHNAPSKENVPLQMFITSDLMLRSFSQP